MTREALRAGHITEDTITDALMWARGDLFVAASRLGCSGRELDSYIRASEGLQAFVAAIVGLKTENPDYKRLSEEQFIDELERKTRAYKVEALDVIHEMATIPLKEDGQPISAAWGEVKLKAAIALKGSVEQRTVVNEQSQVLAELNELYKQNAPRIKTVRAVQIEYQDE